MSTDGEEYTIELGADLKGANLCCAVWNDETVFPEGFEIPEMSRDLDGQDGDFGL